MASGSQLSPPYVLILPQITKQPQISILVDSKYTSTVQLKQNKLDRFLSPPRRDFIPESIPQYQICFSYASHPHILTLQTNPLPPLTPDLIKLHLEFCNTEHLRAARQRERQAHQKPILYLKTNTMFNSVHLGI